MTTKQFFRMFNTIRITMLLVYAWYWIYANQEQPKQEQDVVTTIATNLQSWHKYRGEYQLDIDKLNEEKANLLDGIWYEQTIVYYTKWDYSNIDTETKERLKRIDALLSYAEDKMETIKVPEFTQIKQEQINITGENTGLQ